jgi:hypothetical protein
VGGSWRNGFVIHCSVLLHLYHGFCGDCVYSRLCVIYRCFCAVVLTWHIETRLSQPKSGIRIRIRKHSDLLSLPCSTRRVDLLCLPLCTRLAGPGRPHRLSTALHLGA